MLWRQVSFRNFERRKANLRRYNRLIAVPGGEEVETEVEARLSLDFLHSMVTEQELCDSTKNLPRKIEGSILGEPLFELPEPQLSPPNTVA
jgi:hypothetical protein